jgi:hypothetical protein
LPGVRPETFYRVVLSDWQGNGVLMQPAWRGFRGYFVREQGARVRHDALLVVLQREACLGGQIQGMRGDLYSVGYPTNHAGATVQSRAPKQSGARSHTVAARCRASRATAVCTAYHVVVCRAALPSPHCVWESWAFPVPLWSGVCDVLRSTQSGTSLLFLVANAPGNILRSTYVARAGQRASCTYVYCMYYECFQRQ